MRLYSLVGADQHVDPEYGPFRPDSAGGFDFPDEVSDLIGGFAVKGRKLWETEPERADRLHGMEMARRRDPASMLTAMEENAALTRKVTELMAMLTAAQVGQITSAPALAPAEVPASASAADGGDPNPDPKPAPAKGARASRAAKSDSTGSDTGT